MDPDFLLRLLIGLLFVLIVWLVNRYRRRAQWGGRFNLEEEGLRVAIPLRLAGLVFWLYLPGYVLFPRALAWSTVPLPDSLRWGSWAFAALVIPPMVHWAQTSLGGNVTTTVVTKEDHELVTEGPYRYIRHPLYTTGLLFFVAMSLATGSWLLLVGITFGFIMIMIRTPKEEAQLIERFGDEYRAYMKRTGRFFPRLPGGG